MSTRDIFQKYYWPKLFNGLEDLYNIKYIDNLILEPSRIENRMFLNLNWTEFEGAKRMYN